jgi:peptidoglycan/LPS O-acetylase OafA/YrhL
MTVGLVAFGVLVPVWAVVLGRVLSSPAVHAAVVVAGVATLAVAALPLTREPGGTQDLLHALAATTGYVAMAATPLLAAGPLRRRGHRTAAAASTAVGVLSAACLVGTVALGSGSGALQRAGLGVVDAWHVVAACWVLLAARPSSRLPRGG